MKIAHVFASIEPTGGDRISFHHIDGLRKLGHEVDVYYSGVFDNYWAGREFSDPEMQRTMTQYDPQRMESGGYNFSKYDMVVSNGLFGSYYASCIDHPLKVWFCQNLDKYVFYESTPQDKKIIDGLYRKQENFMAYSPHLLALIEHYYGKKNNVLCTNGITYSEFERFQKKGKRESANSVCFMSAYNGIMKRSCFADLVFKELNERGFETVEINAHRKCMEHSQVFYQNPPFERKCIILAQNCDVMLHPSSFETWSLVTMESMALGLPVVGYDSLGVSIFAKNGHDVVFVDEYDVNKFCEEIENLLTDRDRYLKIQRNGIETASQYDWEDIMPEIEASYFKWLE